MMLEKYILMNGLPTKVECASKAKTRVVLD